MKPPELFSTEAQSTKRARAVSKGMFLQELARDEILERLGAVNKSFSAVAIVSPLPRNLVHGLTEGQRCSRYRCSGSWTCGL